MERNIAANIWTARTIPVLLAGVIGYATYVTVIPLCVDYLLKINNDKSAAISILVVHFLLFILMTSSFLRLLYITTFDPPYVPLGSRAIERERKHSRERILCSKETGIGGGEYDTGTNSGDTTADVFGSSDDLDSPGLELFYTRDIFVCEMDGKPRWCSECMNWKPDRTHHCSSSGRCIKKMDHFCPWVGGPVGENNFKFFLQFTAYSSLFTLHLLVVMSVYIWKQNSSKNETVNRQFAAILALAGFFFLFTAGMTVTSIDLVLHNLTQVEKLGAKTRLQTLAVLKPPSDVLFKINPDLAVQPQYYEITYPLGAGIPPSAEWWQAPEGHPRAKSYIHAQKSSYSQAANLNGSELGIPQPLALPVNVLSRPESLKRPTLQDQSTTSPNNLRPREHFFERDLKATRTFAILNMNSPGDNPWDLGSLIANWETVMGYTFLDYILPLRRSPCCNHEDSESHFMIGPSVDLLRTSVGFLAPTESPNRGLRLKAQRKDSRHEITPKKHTLKSHNKDKPNTLSDGLFARGPSTEMRDLNHETARSTAA